MSCMVVNRRRESEMRRASFEGPGGRVQELCTPKRIETPDMNDAINRGGSMLIWCSGK